MKATCPKNNEHKEFITSAHVMQDWKVDENGFWISTIDESVQTTFSPNKDNIWNCATCGAEAVVE